jgi:Tol biopolymer transport system component
VLWDVEEETVTDGPHGGWGAVWSPDGRWIAYLEDWELWLYSVESGVSFPVVRREPPPDRTTGPGWFAEPRWSHDGTKVVADPGAHRADDQRLILVNLATREFLVQDASRTFTWAPVPKPFRGE